MVPVKLKRLLFYRLPSIPFSIIFLFTPSSPILSSLSSAMVKSQLIYQEAPMAIPDSIFLLFNGLLLVKRYHIIGTNSTSYHNDLDPTTSASRQKNSLNVPSEACLRHTGWI
jgi:hypothetical protein